MLPIVFDIASRNHLLAERAEFASEEPMPLRWHSLLDSISQAETGVGTAELGWRWAITGHARLFAWHPSPEVMATALASRSLVYLCWGVPQRSGLKGRALATLLRRARHVLVNDTTTQREVAGISGRRADVVPFFVDTGFFAFRPLGARGDFLFCNGTNDRDGDVVLGLARHGFKVVWLVNEAAVRARYEGLSGNLEFRSRVSHTELRSLNQTCAAAIMPIVADRHCSGQTTGLEAVACGAPLLITAGRTAGIFASLPGVRTAKHNDIAIWVKAVRDLLSDGGIGERTKLASRMLQQRLSRDAIRDVIAPYFGWRGKACSTVQERTTAA
jgi:hypothetical protein